MPLSLHFEIDEIAVRYGKIAHPAAISSISSIEGSACRCQESPMWSNSEWLNAQRRDVISDRRSWVLLGESVSARRIDDADQLFIALETADIVTHTFGQLLGSVRDAIGAMRGDEHVVQRPERVSDG